MFSYKVAATCAALIALFCALALSREVELSCERRDSHFNFIERFSCSLEIPDGISGNESLVVSGVSGLERDAEDPAKKTSVAVSGGADHPSSMPDGLATLLAGIDAFAYQNTPLRSVKRDDFSGMSENLIKLVLDDNELEDIEPDAFHDLAQLRHLSLDNNRLRQLPASMLDFSPLFKFLFVRNNQLTELPAELFQSTPHFRKLYADRNQIEELSEAMLAKCPELMVISMRENKLTNVPLDFRTFNGLYVADFLGNSGGCDIKYNVNELVPKHCDDDCQRKTVKNIDEFQLKVEDVCRQ